MKKQQFIKLLSKNYKKVVTPDFDVIDYSKFVKKLRNELEMSQTTFAHAIGVSSNTVEKWEMNKNNVSNATKRLLYLLNKNKFLMNQIFEVKTIEVNVIKEYVHKKEKIGKNFEYFSFGDGKKSLKRTEYGTTSDFTLEYKTNSNLKPFNNGEYA